MTTEEIIDELKRTGECYVRNLGRFKIAEYVDHHGSMGARVFENLTFEPSRKFRRFVKHGAVMSDREKQIRDFLKSLTMHELYLLKAKWIHEEQSKRRGIVITPKKEDK